MAETRTPLSQLAAPNVPWFHGAPPTSLAVEPAGRLLLVASRDCVRLMRAESGETVRVMPGFPGKLAALGRWVFVAGGGRIAGLALDDAGASLRVWSLEGEELARHEGDDVGPILDASGDRVVVDAKAGPRVWDLAVGAVVAAVDAARRRLTAAALDSAGERLYVALSAQNQAEPVEAVVDHQIHSVPGGAAIAARALPGRNVGFRQPGPSRAVFLPDGGVLSPGHTGVLEKLSAADLTLVAATPTSRCLDLALEPASEHAIVTRGAMHSDPAYEFRLHGAERVRVADLHVAPLDLDAWSVAILPDGRHVLGLGSGVLRGDGVTEPRNPRRFEAIGFDGEVVIADTEGGGLALDPKTLELRGEVDPRSSRLPAMRGQLSANGLHRVTLDPGLTVRDATGTVSWRDDAVTAFALAPDGVTIVCGRALSIGGLTRRRLENGVRVNGFDPFSSQTNSGRLTAVALSKSGRVAASDMDGVVMIYEKGDKRGFGAPHYDLRTPVRSLAWHPDEKRLAIGLGGDRGSIFVTGDKPLTLAGHHADVRALWFTPDGARLVSAGGDGQIFVWDVSPQ